MSTRENTAGRAAGPGLGSASFSAVAWAAALAALVALSSAGARAQGDPVGDAADAEARSLFEAARAAFNEGRNEDALANFRRSYELSHRAELLYNIAQTLDRLRRDQEALDAFTAYLRAIPTAANREEVEARMGVLRQVISDRATLGAESSTSTAADAEVDEAASGDRAAGAVGRDVVTEWWFWTLIGGGVLVAAGVTIGVVVATQPQPQPLLDGEVGGVIFALEVRP